MLTATVVPEVPVTTVTDLSAAESVVALCEAMILFSNLLNASSMSSVCSIAVAAVVFSYPVSLTSLIGVLDALTLPSASDTAVITFPSPLTTAKSIPLIWPCNLPSACPRVSLEAILPLSSPPTV